MPNIEKIKLKAFVLTCEALDSGVRKNNFCTKYLSRYEFVEGVCKHNIDDYLDIMKNPFDYGFGNCSWDLAAAAICYGHYEIWNKIVQQNETCLVLEDDIDILPHISHLNDYIDNAHRYDDLSILSLWKTGGTDFAHHNQFYNQLNGSYANYGTQGYIVNPKTAKFLIDHFLHIQEPVDHYILGALTLKNLHYTAYVTKQNVVVHKDGTSLRLGG